MLAAALAAAGSCELLPARPRRVQPGLGAASELLRPPWLPGLIASAGAINEVLFHSYTKFSTSTDPPVRAHASRVSTIHNIILDFRILSGDPFTGT